MGHQSVVMIHKVYGRLAKVRPARRPFVEYWGPDGRFPGEDLVRKILGNDQVDALLREAEAAAGSAPDQGEPRLRLVK